MDIWRILEIEPTSDKNIIKEAYMKKLAVCHPEDNPEGFKNLRQAYEEALNWDSKKNSESPYSEFISDVIEIYSDFYKRIDEEIWRELLSRDICLQIDTEFEVSKELLKFLMDNYYLPHDIFKLLCKHFLWEERKQELINEFPSDFITYILNRSKYDDSINYYEFEIIDNNDIDEFIGSFFTINNKMYDNNLVGIEEDFVNLKFLNSYHYEAGILEARYYSLSKDNTKAEQIVNSLLELYGEKEHILYAAGNIQLNLSNFRKAKEYFLKVVELKQSEQGMNLCLGECYYGEKNYIDAKEYYRKHLDEFPYNAYTREKFYYVNQDLINYYTSLPEEELDNENIYKLAASYFNCSMYKEADDCLKKYIPSESNLKRYYDFYVDNLIQLYDFKSALELIDKWNLIDKDNSLLLERKTFALYKNNDFEECLKICDDAIELYPENAYFPYIKALYYFDNKDFDKAMELIEHSYALDDSLLFIVILKAEIEYSLNNYNDAYETTKIALDIYPYTLQMYIIQAKIFYDVEDYEKLLEVSEAGLEIADEHNEFKYYKAIALRFLNRADESEDILLELTELDEPDSKYYYELALLNYDKYDYKKALEHINFAIELDSLNMVYYLYRAKFNRFLKNYEDSFKDFDYVEKNGGSFAIHAYNDRGLLHLALESFDKAMTCFEKVIEIDPETRYGYTNLGDVYSDIKNYEKALECYNKQLELTENAYLYTSRGIVYLNLGKKEDAINDYLKSGELDENYPYSYANLAYLYYCEGNYEESVKYCKITLEKDKFILNTYIRLADSYYALRDFENCLKTYEEMLEIYTEPSDVFYILEEKADFFYYTNKYEEALEIYKKINNSVKDNLRVYDMIASSYYNLRDYNNAIKYLKLGLEIDENNEALNYTMGGILLKIRRNPSKALDYYLKALKTNPNSENNFLKVAYCYKELNKNSIAVKNYEESYALITKKINDLEKEDKKVRPCFYVRLGNCLVGLKKYEEAEKYFNLAIEKSALYNFCFLQSCDEAYFGLAKLYRRKEDFDSAEQYYDKAYETQNKEEYIIEKEEMLKNKNKLKSNFFKRLFDKN